MIPEQPSNLSRKCLIQNTGVQFLDVDIDLSDERTYARHERNYFTSELYLITQKKQRVEEGQYTADDETVGFQYFNETLHAQAAELPDKYADLEDTLAMFEEKWIPLPYFMSKDEDGHFKRVPLNWCRGYLKAIDRNRRRYRLVLAFDTTTIDSSDKDNLSWKNYGLNEQDISSGSSYKLCDCLEDVCNYVVGEHFVDVWIKNLWQEYAKKQEYSDRRYNLGLTDKDYQRNYLQYVFLLLDPKVVTLPTLTVKVFSKSANEGEPCIRVNLALDIGNSRICGLMYESVGKDTEGIKNRYQIAIRDFTHPEQVYNRPFSSNVEFAYPSFSPLVPELPSQMFNWHSMVRVGDEAQQLSWTLQGNEGSTGMSSPKRYLWDTDDSDSNWKINLSSVYGHSQGDALMDPICSLITSSGEVIAPEDNFSIEAVYPRYSRSSMMTFLICELLAQIESQINSISERSKHSHADVPRYIENIVLTVPTAMPVQEVNLFRKRVDQAITLYWMSMKWLKVQTDDVTGKRTALDPWPPRPEVVIKYDEAICSQIVYLYNELQSKFAGHFHDFAQVLSRSQTSDSITVATVDFGGGTTDFVINKYTLEEHSNDAFYPTQMFRESFKIAGDDILLELVQQYVIPSVEEYCRNELGISKSSIDEYLSDKIGVHSRDKTIQAQTLKKQLTLQLFYPLGLAVFNSYQSYGTDRFVDLDGLTFGQVLEKAFPNERHEVTSQVIDYISGGIRKLSGNADFSITAVPLNVNFRRIHHDFVTCNTFDICIRAISYICEVINSYKCDVVLLSGRPSMLPGIESAFRNKLLMPHERIVKMSDIRIGSWYPYAAAGRIEDPKTTVAVGALQLHSCNMGKTQNFYIKLGDNVKLKSSIRYIGKLDSHGNKIAKEDVYYSDVDLDNPSYKLEGTFTIPGRVTIGYRNLDIQRWPANPLYRILLAGDLSRQLNEVKDGYLKLSLERQENEDALDSKARYSRDELRLKGSCKAGNRDIEVITEGSGRNVELKLCTMPFKVDGDTSYWLDSGCIRDE